MGSKNSSKKCGDEAMTLPPEESRKIAERIVSEFMGQTMSSNTNVYDWLESRIAAALEAERKAGVKLANLCAQELKAHYDRWEEAEKEAKTEGYRWGLETAAKLLEEQGQYPTTEHSLKKRWADKIRAKIGEVGE